MNANYFSYIRVSTLKQGQTGTSLDEQRAAINRYAERQGFSIIREFEEKETAAKLGRPIFEVMLKGLQKGEAKGVIIHKIDRSARNLKDWANLGELIDRGIEVHFANESLDLQSRGGRLSADIQAVVAADYIRNLREETKKGFYGRLKQGLYPRPAPIGYLDQGQGKPKIPDPVKAPLIWQMFELYAAGNHTIEALQEKLYALGLRTRSGGKMTISTISDSLRNPFYCGLIRIQKTGELYPGAHQPLITKALFDRVQLILAGRAVSKKECHSFLFRKLLRCQPCQSRLIAERQKGYVYYRCHTKECPQKTVREEVVDEAFRAMIQTLRFSDKATQYFRQWAMKQSQALQDRVKTQQKALQLQLEQMQSRLSKLTDAYLDGVVEQSVYLEKKNGYVTEMKSIQQQMAGAEEKLPQTLRQLDKFLELANNAYLSYKLGTEDEKRELVKTITSNLFIERKTIIFKLHYPFQQVYEQHEKSCGGPQRDSPRTLTALLSQLVTYFQNHDLPEPIVALHSRIPSLQGNLASGIAQGI